MIRREEYIVTLEESRVTADAPPKDIDLNGLIKGIVISAPDLDAATYGIVIKDQNGATLFSKTGLTKAVQTAIILDANNRPLEIPIAVNNAPPIGLTTPDTTASEGELSSNSDVPIADNDTVTIGSKTYRFKNTLAQANDILIETAVVASGTITSTANGNPASGGTVTVGDVAYTFRTNLTEAYATAVLTSDTTNPIAGETVTVGAKEYTFRTTLTEVYATGTVTLAANGNPGDGGTITIGDKTYRFKDTLAQANDVKIGADGEATLNNLRAAINDSGTEGVNYGTGTTANAQVNAPSAAAVSTDATLAIKADALGTGGNAIIFTEDSAANLTVSGSGFLTGGVDAIANEIKIGANTDATLANLRDAINGGATEGTDYSTGTTANAQATSGDPTANAITLTAIAIGTGGNSIAKAETSTHLDFDGAGAVFTGGVAAVANEIKIGADGEATLNNLRAALAAAAGVGSTYSTGTVANPLANAPDAAVLNVADYDLVVEAIIAGDVGNGYVLTESATNITVSGSGTLANGDSKHTETLTNLADAINGEDGGGESGTKYHAGTVAHPDVTATDAVGDVLTIAIADEATTDGADISLTETSASLSWGNPTMQGGGESEDRQFTVALLVQV